MATAMIVAMPVLAAGPTPRSKTRWAGVMTRAWLVRAGRHGERETLALEQGLAVVGWPELQDLSGHATRASLMDALRQAFPDDGTKQLLNWQAQLWAFLHTISEGDLAVLPLKTSPAVAIGQVTGSYTYRPDLPPDARHTRPVKWLATDLPAPSSPRTCSTRWAPF